MFFLLFFIFHFPKRLVVVFPFGLAALSSFTFFFSSPFPSNFCYPGTIRMAFAFLVAKKSSNLFALGASPAGCLLPGAQVFSRNLRIGSPLKDYSKIVPLSIRQDLQDSNRPVLMENRFPIYYNLKETNSDLTFQSLSSFQNEQGYCRSFLFFVFLS